jgi:hypothetical protein
MHSSRRNARHHHMLPSHMTASPAPSPPLGPYNGRQLTAAKAQQSANCLTSKVRSCGNGASAHRPPPPPPVPVPPPPSIPGPGLCGADLVEACGEQVAGREDAAIGPQVVLLHHVLVLHLAVVARQDNHWLSHVHAGEERCDWITRQELETTGRCPNPAPGWHPGGGEHCQLGAVVRLLPPSVKPCIMLPDAQQLAFCFSWPLGQPS